MMDKHKYSFTEYEISTCSVCPCCHGYGTYECCGIEMRSISIDIFREKPKWCPLKDEGVV